MSTLDSVTLWSATSLASDESKIGAAGLSVRQRKLLSLMSQPTSVADLAQGIALPINDVRTALQRFNKLGLAQSTAQQSFNPMETRLRSHQATPTASRMSLILGLGVAALIAVSAGAWMLRGGTTAAPTPIALTKNNGSEAAVASVMSPGDAADTVRSGAAVRSAALAAALPASTAKPAAATTPSIDPSAPTAVRPVTLAPLVAPTNNVETAPPVAVAAAAPTALSPATVSTAAPASAVSPALALAPTLPATAPATPATPASAANTPGAAAVAAATPSPAPAPATPAAITAATPAAQTVTAANTAPAAPATTRSAAGAVLAAMTPIRAPCVRACKWTHEGRSLRSTLLRPPRRAYLIAP